MKVSVLMPMRNAVAYVRTAIESVLSQDYDSIELIGDLLCEALQDAAAQKEQLKARKVVALALGARRSTVEFGSCQASCRVKVSNQAACLAASGSLC